MKRRNFLKVGSILGLVAIGLTIPLATISCSSTTSTSDKKQDAHSIKRPTPSIINVPSQITKVNFSAANTINKTELTSEIGLLDAKMKQNPLMMYDLTIDFSQYGLYDLKDNKCLPDMLFDLGTQVDGLHFIGLKTHAPQGELDYIFNLDARFSKFKKLRTLEILGTKDEGIIQCQSNSLNALNSLVTLKIMGHSIYNVDDIIAAKSGASYSIENIDIKTNDLNQDHVPSFIYNLPDLVELSIGSKISKLDDRICSFKYLWFLDLSNNQISNLPNSRFQSNYLSTINLANNNIASIPDALLKNSMVYNLNLTNNNLNDFNSSFSSLSNLGVLNINDNLFDKIPQSVLKLTQLLELSCASNQHSLKVIDKDISNLKSLKVLNLTGNAAIEVIPSTIKNMQTINDLRFPVGADVFDDGQMIPESLSNAKLIWLNLTNYNA